MLAKGPIPGFVHAVIEYLAAAVFIVAPFVLGFDSGAATAVSIVVGVVVLFVVATTDGPLGLSRQIPIGAHVVLDYALAGALIAVPFIFGFSDETDPTAFFIVLGVVHLLLTIGTRFRPPEPADAEPRRAEPPAQAQAEPLPPAEPAEPS